MYLFKVLFQSYFCHIYRFLSLVQTDWENLDKGENGHDTELLGDLYRRGRSIRCHTPIAMEVRDVVTNETFKGSSNFNQDGLPTPEIFNLWEGFKCTNAGQPDVNPEDVGCSDYEVRYQCLNNVIDLQGNVLLIIYNN